MITMTARCRCADMGVAQAIMTTADRGLDSAIEWFIIPLGADSAESLRFIT